MSEVNEEQLAAMPRDVLDKAVKHLRETLSKESIDDIRALYDLDPKGWWVDIHNGWGREIRDSLRINAGLYDHLLPDGGWEVFYVYCVEIAIGKRQMPAESRKKAA